MEQLKQMVTRLTHVAVTCSWVNDLHLDKTGRVGGLPRR
jgi:hypothetical protein